MKYWPLLFILMLPATAAQINSLALIDASSNQVINGYETLSDEVINLNDVPNQLSIRADATASTESVVFSINGQEHQTENQQPYALSGDSNGDYDPWAPTTGDYTIQADAYDAADGTGTLLGSDEITLTFTETTTSPTARISADPTLLPDDDNRNTQIDLSAAKSYDAQGGSQITYEWSLPADAQLTTGTTTSETLSITLPGGEPYTLTLTVTDQNTGESDTITTIIGVEGDLATLTGELKQWHKTTLSFTGPMTSESADPNPFLDYRLDVTFNGPSGQKYVVPGFYAADGNAAETSATSGNTWQVHFTPDEAGEWTYTASFRQGTAVAVQDRNAGSSAGYFDGAAGSFTVTTSDKTGRDHRAKGRLNYVGKHHLRHANGDYFLKGGADAPENFLNYDDFDNTPPHKYRKSWSPHDQDHNSDDPSWQGGKGTEIIGAINYLANKGMNAFSFIPMTYKGDDKNVFPWTAKPNNGGSVLRYDVSKLAQWGVVFDHATTKGMYLHFKTQETENDHYLDGGNVGTERKLYYRELIARFGHNLALNWNLGEENTQSDAARKAMADYFEQVDPYDHPVVIHTYPNDHNNVYGDLIGYPAYDGASIQLSGMNNGYPTSRKWIQESSDAGRPWIVALDEPGSAGNAAPCQQNTNYEDEREEALWGNLMAGGAGVEWYFGYQTCQSDLTLEDFRTRDQLWDHTRHALTFVRDNLNYWDTDVCTANNAAYCLSDNTDTHALYLTSPTTPSLDLPTGDYTIRWYNPRTGTYQDGGSVSGGNSVSLGQAPYANDNAVLVTPHDAAQTPDLSITPGTGTYQDSVDITLDGPSPIYYTLDGSTPTMNSQQYTNPFTVDTTTTVTAATFDGTAPATVTRNPSKTTFVVEAEAYETQRNDDERRWYTITPGNSPDLDDPDGNHASTAVQATYLEILPDTRVTHNDPLNRGTAFKNYPGNNPVGVLEYDITFPEAGTYYVWVRAHPTGSEDNGIHVGLNGNWPDSGARIQWCGTSGWAWSGELRIDPDQHCNSGVRATIDVPTAGTHTVMFSMREDGFEFDRFIFTKDQSYDPENGGSDIADFTNSVCWSDSFAVNGQCYCDSNLDHNGNDYLSETVMTSDGAKTVEEVCNAHASYDIPDGQRTYYNDVQCGNGPRNAANDERICQGIPQSSSCTSSSYQGQGCGLAGPTWDLSMFGGADTTLDQTVSATYTIETGINPDDFANPIDGFTIAQSGSDFTVTIDDTVVWKNIYYYDGTWNEVTTPADVGNWAVGSAQTTVPGDASHVAAFSCVWDEGWNCHGDNWMLRTTP